MAAIGGSGHSVPLPTPPPGPPGPVTPFWAWNRLETRPRQQDFNKSLRAEIHDPLWMLGRQWQMGEFSGMDSGSGIVAKTQIDYQKIDAVDRFAAHTAVPYNMATPLESMVEAIPYNWSIKERILMGKKWLWFVNKALGSSYSTFTGWFDTIQVYPDGFRLDVTEPVSTMTDTADIVAGADIYSDANVSNFIAAMKFSGQVTDGAVVYEVLATGGIAALATVNGSAVPSGIAGALPTAISDYMAWVQKAYSLPVNNQENWLPSTLEYQYDTYWAAPATGVQYRLAARKYHGGHLDWHSFVQDTATYSPAGGVTPSSGTFFQEMMMSQSHFPGMPSARWWEFEDGAVNLCNLDADPTDMAKIMLTQFALIYQNDWFVVPCKLPVGAYCKVRGVVVTDVFGVTSYVGNYSSIAATATISGINTVTAFNESGTDWKGWRWLDVSLDTSVINTSPPTGCMAITPVTAGTLESKPIESVLFMRDEMADLVWGIENIVPDKLGKGRDGLDNASKFVEYLRKLKNSADENAIVPPDPQAKLSYQLEANPVPENWIPFTPVHVSPPATNNRQIHYQRAAMPRIIDKYTNSMVRPRTDLLSYGLKSLFATTAPSVYFPQSFGRPPQSYQPYYLNEEEVPKGGTIVETRFKRTRWFNGKTVSWVGRKRTMGRGEGNSGLTFDKINTLKQ